MRALTAALLKSFAADRPALLLAFLAPLAFFSLFAVFFRHLEDPAGAHFPVALIVEARGDAAERLASAIEDRSGGRISIERIDGPTAPPSYVGSIEIPSGFDPGRPVVHIASRWPMPGVTDAMRQLVTAASALARIDAGGVGTLETTVVDDSPVGSLIHAALPGIAVLFVLFALSSQASRGVGDDEAGLGERLRSLGLSARRRLLARFATLASIGGLQLGALLVFAALVFGVVPRQPAALLAAAAATAACCAAYTVLLVEACGTRARFAAVAPVCTLLLAGLGGSMVPVSLLPESLAAPSRVLFTGWSVEACLGAIEGQTRSLQLALLAGTTLVFLYCGAFLANRREAR